MLVEPWIDWRGGLTGVLTNNWLTDAGIMLYLGASFSPTAESGSGVVRGGPEVRFHEGSTRVPPEFHQGSEVLRGLRWCEH